MENAGNYYLIRHLVLFTGLTDRTICSYISSGILQGEKINGLWHFISEQEDAFIRRPAVRRKCCNWSTDSGKLKENNNERRASSALREGARL